MPRAKSRKQTPSQKAGAIAKRRGGPRLIEGQTEDEQAFHLLPRLSSGKVILADGWPREIGFDPQSGKFIARYAEGEFFLLNKKLEPIERAKPYLVRRCRFPNPRPIEGIR
jgi:hypothetical protein